MVLEVKYLGAEDIIKEKNIVLCLGFFDGLHKAHTQLIEKAGEIAKAKNLPLAVFTFSMSVKAFLINQPHRCLTTIQDKARILENYDVDYLYVMKVSDEIIHMEAEEFVKRYLKPTNTVVAGFDFNFGYRGKGDRHMLLASKDFETVIISEIKYLGEKVGATRIKSNLREGNLPLVNLLLGRNYSIKGEVIPGRQIARKLGFPTANVDYMPYYLPKSGVYYTKVVYKGKQFDGITNIGFKPTYKDQLLTVETYIFGLSEDLYGETIEVIFMEYLRPEREFTSEANLSKQIINDITYVKNKIEENHHE